MRLSKYNINYEKGKCPFGYTFVPGYIKLDGTHVDSFCRKLKKNKPNSESFESFKGLDWN